MLKTSAVQKMDKVKEGIEHSKNNLTDELSNNIFNKKSQQTKMISDLKY